MTPARDPKQCFFCYLGGGIWKEASTHQHFYKPYSSVVQIAANTNKKTNIFNIRAIQGRAYFTRACKAMKQKSMCFTWVCEAMKPKSTHFTLVCKAVKPNNVGSVGNATNPRKYKPCQSFILLSFWQDSATNPGKYKPCQWLSFCLC